MGRPRRRHGLTLLAALGALLAGCTSGGAADPRTSSAAPATSPVPSVSSSVTSGFATTAPPARPRPSHPKPAGTAPKRSPAPHAVRDAQHLPLGFATGRATQVLTAVAPSTGSTRATLQTWRKVAGGWRAVGPAVPAWLGSAGLSRHPSESKSATPIGSFTLTQAFGHDADPGTALPYTRTTPADWWISEPGPQYNTRQRCTSGCGFTRGDPNEHLYYETPYYNYAVVIDYNTPNAPGGVRQGAGSAFFLHVTVGAPTAGCISIAQDQLVRILRWLKPRHAPRILIGVG